jgi:hypothetical protein
MIDFVLCLRNNGQVIVPRDFAKDLGGVGMVA